MQSDEDAENDEDEVAETFQMNWKSMREEMRIAHAPNSWSARASQGAGCKLGWSGSQSMPQDRCPSGPLWEDGQTPEGIKKNRAAECGEGARMSVQENVQRALGDAGAQPETLPEWAPELSRHLDAIEGAFMQGGKEIFERVTNSLIDAENTIVGRCRSTDDADMLVQEMYKMKLERPQVGPPLEDSDDEHEKNIDDFMDRLEKGGF
eukprot:5663510-Pyramimonas_sp.AAC.1